MTIQEQIQIVEDNLNEYGQCNITIDEFNFLKDEFYSSGCLAGIELGRAEAFDEFVAKYKEFQNTPCDVTCGARSCDGECINCFVIWYKEQKK